MILHRFPRLGPGPWSWLETGDGAGGIIMPISCDTQIDCRQGDITRALFLVSNLLLHVIRVCGVCVFFYFFPFQGINLSLPPPLFPLQRTCSWLREWSGWGPGQQAPSVWSSMGLQMRLGTWPCQLSCLGCKVGVSQSQEGLLSCGPSREDFLKCLWSTVSACMPLMTVCSLIIYRGTSPRLNLLIFHLICCTELNGVSPEAQR